jgi:hypothetical protein
MMDPLAEIEQLFSSSLNSEATSKESEHLTCRSGAGHNRVPCSTLFCFICTRPALSRQKWTGQSGTFFLLRVSIFYLHQLYPRVLQVDPPFDRAPGDASSKSTGRLRHLLRPQLVPVLRRSSGLPLGDKNMAAVDDKFDKFEKNRLSVLLF